jgi:hypothetical protein
MLACRLAALTMVTLIGACSPSVEKAAESAPPEGAPGAAQAAPHSPSRSKATGNIRRALDVVPEEMRGRVAAQGLSEVDEYPLVAAERKALEFAAGASVEPAQCEAVLAKLVSELDAPLVEKACGDRATLMKALAGGAPDRRLTVAQKNCKVTLDAGQKARSTAMAVIVSAVLRQQFAADPASSDDERLIASFVAQTCHR